MIRRLGRPFQGFAHAYRRRARLWRWPPAIPPRSRDRSRSRIPRCPRPRSLAMASWFSRLYAASAFGRSFLRFANAGGSMMTTSNRAPCRANSSSTSKASPLRVSSETRLRSRVRRRQFKRSRGTVDARDLARAEVRRAHSPGSHIAEDIQDPAALRHVSGQCAAVGGLIEEPAGLLSFHQGRVEFEAVFDHQCGLIEVALHGLDIARQALHFPRGAVVLEKQRLRT